MGKVTRAVLSVGLATQLIPHAVVCGSLASQSTYAATQEAVLSDNEFVEQAVRERLPAKFKDEALEISQAVIEAAERHELDPLLLVAVVTRESGFNPNAIGGHGEIGLMQLKPATALWILKRNSHMNVKMTESQMREALFEPRTNIRMGAAYLAYLSKKFNGRSNRFLTAYNMGAHSLRSHLKNGVEPREYSDRILETYRTLVLENVKADANAGSSQQVASRSWTSLF